MTEHDAFPSRRSAIVTALGAFAAAALPLARSTAAAPMRPSGPAGSAGRGDHRHDWDWLVGRWNVRHHRLKGRLVGSTEWEDFPGTSELWTTLGGYGTVDDNLIELPGGAYRAVGIRAFDPEASRWAIWWLDARYPTTIEPPVFGGFKDGIGTFLGRDTLRGKPIEVRFEWSGITATSAHWEQAFSGDGGKTWEVNWTMEFSRAGA